MTTSINPYQPAATAGWVPNLALVNDLERGITAIQVTGWVGGAGKAPTAAVGQYVGPEGYVESIEDATNVSLFAVSRLTAIVQDVVGSSFSFSSLSDTPASYSGRSLQLLRVNEAESGIDTTTIGPAQVVAWIDQQLGNALWQEPSGLDQTEVDARIDANVQAYARDGTSAIPAAQLPDASASEKGAMTAADKAKLDGVAQDAEVNVQSDWAQTDSAQDDYIKNKPLIGDQGLQQDEVDARVREVVEDFAETGNSASVPATKLPLVSSTSRGAMGQGDKQKLDGIAANADVNVQADWDVTDSNSDAFIRNKPVASAGLDQTQVDARVRAGVADFAEEGNTQAVPPSKLPTATDSARGAMTPEQKQKLDGIEANATADQSGIEIKDQLEALTGNDRLSATYIRNLPETSNSITVQSPLSGDGTSGNPVTITLPDKTYRGTYSATATYNQGDIVSTSSQRYWICTADGTTGQTPGSSEAALWHPINEYEGSWSSTEAPYPAGSIVQNDGHLWFNTWANNSSEPGTTTGNGPRWIQISGATATLADGSVTTAKLAENAVTRAKMAHGTGGKYLGYGSDGAPAELDSPAGLDQTQVDARVRAGVADFAEEGNTQAVPPSKLPTATDSARGAMTPEQKQKLDGIEANATADQSGIEIKDQLEALTGNDRLSATYIRNLPETSNSITVQSPLSGDGTSGNPVTITLPDKTFRGTYSAAATYNQGDIVATSAQRYWICTTDGTVGLQPGTEAQRWHSLGEWNGAWSSSEAPYPVGAFVTYNNHVWVSTWADNSFEPGSAADTNNRWRNVTDTGQDNIHTGTSEPASSLGAVGDIYAKTGGTPVIYVKTDATTWTEISAPVSANEPQTLVAWASNSGTSIGHLELQGTATAAHVPDALALSSEDDDKTLQIFFSVGVGSSATHRSSGFIIMPVSRFRAFTDTAANTSFNNIAATAMRESATINAIGGSGTTEARLIVSKQNDSALLFGSSETSNLYLYSLTIVLQSHRGIRGLQGPRGEDGADSQLPAFPDGNSFLGVLTANDEGVLEWQTAAFPALNLSLRYLITCFGNGSALSLEDFNEIDWRRFRNGNADGTRIDRLAEVAPTGRLRRHLMGFVPGSITGGFTGYKAGVGGEARYGTLIPDLSVWGNGLIGSATIDQVSWSTTQNETVVSFTPDVEQDLQDMAHAGVRLAITDDDENSQNRVAYDKALIDGQVAGGLIVFGGVPDFNSPDEGGERAFFLYRKQDDTVANYQELLGVDVPLAANKKIADLAHPSEHQGLTEVALNDFVRVNDHDFTNPIGTVRFQGSTGSHNSYNYYGYLSSSVWHPGVSGFGALLSDPEMEISGWTGTVRLRRFTQDGRSIRIAFNVDESDLIAAAPADLRWVLYDPANDSIITQAPFSIGATTDDEQVYEHLLFEDILPSGISSTFLQGKTLEVAIFVRRDPIDSVSELKPVVVRRQALTPEEWSQHVSMWNAIKRGSGVVEEATITAGEATNGAHGYWSSNYLGGGSGSNGSTTDSSLDLSKLTRDGTGTTKTIDALFWSTLKHVVISFTDQTESDFLPNFHYDLRMALVHGEQVLFDDAFTNADVIAPGTNGEAISWVHAVPNPFPDGAVIKALFYRSSEALDLDHIRNGALNVPHTPTRLMDFTETGTEVEKAANQLHIVGPSWERQPTADDDERYLKIWAVLSSNGAGNDTVVCHGEVPVDYWRAGSEHADATAASAVNFRVSLTPAYGTGGGSSGGTIWRRPYVGKITGGRLGIGVIGNTFYVHKARVVLV